MELLALAGCRRHTQNRFEANYILFDQNQRAVKNQSQFWLARCCI